MSSLVPETGFAQGASGAANVYDTSPSGLGLSPSYLAGNANAAATSVSGSNAQLAYVEVTSPVTISATSEGTANTVATAPSLTFNGTTTVVVEFFAPQWVSPAAVSDSFLVIYEDGASIGWIGVMHNTSSSEVASMPVLVKKEIVPTAAAHVFSVRAYVTSGSGRVDGGTGGVAAYNPCFIRIATV